MSRLNKRFRRMSHVSPIFYSSLPDASRELADAVLKKDSKTVKALLQNTAEKANSYFLQQPLLSHAIESRSYETVKVLLEAKADPTASSHWYGMPLDHAAIRNYNEIVSLLMGCGAIKDEETENQNPIWIAVQTSNYLEADDLAGTVDLNQPDKMGRYLLEIAAEHKDLKMMETLLRYRADPNIVANDGTLLMVKAARIGDVAMLHLLSSNGAYANLRDSSGMNAREATKSYLSALIPKSPFPPTSPTNIPKRKPDFRDSLSPIQLKALQHGHSSEWLDAEPFASFPVSEDYLSESDIE